MATEDRNVYTSAPTPLMLKDAGELLKNDYLPFEAGFGQTSDGMYHIAASTYVNIPSKAAFLPAIQSFNQHCGSR